MVCNHCWLSEPSTVAHTFRLGEAARVIVAQEGITGLFGRGLKTRILANGLQGILFSILWKIFLDL